MKQQQRKTNWYVITGGPGCGKTTTVNLLKDKGYKTTIEHARHYIDTQLIAGRTTEEVRHNQQESQSRILAMQIAAENLLPADDIVFLDRAIPDALAYYRFLKLPTTQILEEALKNHSYKKVFILDPLPIIQDYARIEDAAAQRRIHDLLTEVYTSLGLPVVHVPVLPPGERVNFILKNL